MLDFVFGVRIVSSVDQDAGWVLFDLEEADHHLVRIALADANEQTLGEPLKAGAAVHLTAFNFSNRFSTSSKVASFLGNAKRTRPRPSAGSEA